MVKVVYLDPSIDWFVIFGDLLTDILIFTGGYHEHFWNAIILCILPMG